jgi:hypothetical protein
MQSMHESQPACFASFLLLVTVVLGMDYLHMLQIICQILHPTLTIGCSFALLSWSGTTGG